MNSIISIPLKSFCKFVVYR